MKSCPTCNRTYPDDTLAFCLMDGSVLSAPFDPNTGKEIHRSRESSPPATELMPLGSEPSDLTSGDENTLPAKIASPPVTTIQASPPSVAPPPPSARARVAVEDSVTKVAINEPDNRKDVQNKVRFVMFVVASLVLAVMALFTIDGLNVRLIRIAVAIVFAVVAWRYWLAVRSR